MAGDVEPCLPWALLGGQGPGPGLACPVKLCQCRRPPARARQGQLILAARLPGSGMGPMLQCWCQPAAPDTSACPAQRGPGQELPAGGSRGTCQHQRQAQAEALPSRAAWGRARPGSARDLQGPGQVPSGPRRLVLLLPSAPSLRGWAKGLVLSDGATGPLAAQSLLEPPRARASLHQPGHKSPAARNLPCWDATAWAAPGRGCNCLGVRWGEGFGGSRDPRGSPGLC